MGRRTSGGQIGLEKIGLVQADAATLTTTQTDSDLTLNPNGSGEVVVESNVLMNGQMTFSDQNDLRLAESSTNGTNYIAMQAAASMSANYTITWPAAVSSTAGYVLTSDASGNLSWASAGGNIPVSDSGSTATVHYPFFGTNGGSLPSTLAPLTRTNLAFVPSTGELSSTIGRHPDLIGSTSNSGTVTIRGTSSATKATASVLMTDGVASTSTTTGTLVVTGGVGISGAIYASSGVIEGTLNQYYSENATSVSKTIQLADRDKVVTCTNTTGNDITITLPDNATVAFPIGSKVYIYRKGTGGVTIATGGSATVNKTGTMAADEEFYVRKRGTNEWVVVDVPKLLKGAGGSLSATSGYTVHTYTSGSSTFVAS